MQNTKMHLSKFGNEIVGYSRPSFIRETLEVLAWIALIIIGIFTAILWVVALTPSYV
jgi:hypothetical protein